MLKEEGGEDFDFFTYHLFLCLFRGMIMELEKGVDKSGKWMGDHESPIWGPEGYDYLQFTFTYA